MLLSRCFLEGRMEFVRDFIFGVIVGIANIIPGVSGGTMAVMLGIYDKLIGAITLSFKKIRENFWFLLLFGIGAVAGIVAFSNLIKYLLENFPVATNFSFIGLIIGSVPMIFTRAKGERINWLNTVAFVIAFGLMIFISVLNRDSINNKLVTTLNTPVFIWLTLVSAISAFAMILPGISGSFVMLVLGGYTTVLTAIADRNIVLLIPVGVGVVFGLLLGTALVRYLLRYFEQATYFAILGLVVGSIFSILPFASIAVNAELFIAIVLMVLLSIVAYIFSKK